MVLCAKHDYEFIYVSKTDSRIKMLRLGYQCIYFSFEKILHRLSILLQEVILYSDKTSCQHSVMSQYVFRGESSKTDSDIT